VNHKDKYESVNYKEVLICESSSKVWICEL